MAVLGNKNAAAAPISLIGFAGGSAGVARIRYSPVALRHRLSTVLLWAAYISGQSGGVRNKPSWRLNSYIIETPQPAPQSPVQRSRYSVDRQLRTRVVTPPQIAGQQRQGFGRRRRVVTSAPQ